MSFGRMLQEGKDTKASKPAGVERTLSPLGLSCSDKTDCPAAEVREVLRLGTCSTAVWLYNNETRFCLLKKLDPWTD